MKEKKNPYNVIQITRCHGQWMSITLYNLLKKTALVDNEYRFMGSVGLI